MRTTIMVSTLIGGVLFMLLLWSELRSSSGYPSTGEPVTATAVTMDEAPEDDAQGGERMGYCPLMKPLILVVIPNLYPYLTVPAIFRPPIA